MTHRHHTTLVTLTALVLLLSSCGFGDTAETEEEGWWTDRTWAGEIDVCIGATDDVAGCQWLAAILIHRRCSLKVYQTFAAGLMVGGSFEIMYSDAETSGDCEGPADSTNGSPAPSTTSDADLDADESPERSHQCAGRASGYRDPGRSCAR